MSGYNPPFEISNKMIAMISEISELIGKIKSTAALDKNSTLRRRNRILTIHSSLCIEQNTLTIEQVTAVLGGKQVLAPPKDIEEAKNAYEIYENLDLLDPYSCDDLLKAHGVMMRGLVQLFDVDRSDITKHLKNIFDEGELSEISTCANFAQVARLQKRVKEMTDSATDDVRFATMSERLHQGLIEQIDSFIIQP